VYGPYSQRVTTFHPHQMPGEKPHRTLSLRHEAHGKQTDIKLHTTGFIDVTVRDAPQEIMVGGEKVLLPSESDGESTTYAYHRFATMYRAERAEGDVAIGPKEALAIEALCEASRPPRYTIEDVFMPETLDHTELRSVRIYIAQNGITTDTPDYHVSAVDAAGNFLDTMQRYVDEAPITQQGANAFRREIRETADGQTIEIAANVEQDGKLNPGLHITTMRPATTAELQAVGGGDSAGGSAFVERKLQLAGMPVVVTRTGRPRILIVGTLAETLTDMQASDAESGNTIELSKQLVIARIDYMQILRNYLLQKEQHAI
jgi:hypothetical protein